ncbi:AAA domain-containing protein [Candidatus Bathyarchaeota archaeon]|nr:AAA domain-containing protein [Candidatus Bathyarchaeota archaeon]
MQLKGLKEITDRILDTIQTYFVGDRELLQKVLAASLANGHILFEDNPGLGKTLLAKVFAKATGCEWSRIQFTPDLMPSDITGTKVWRMNTGEFSLEKGPVFTHILLADEINRSPPKVQSALLECMEERQVTIEGETHSLDRPFFVIATQNPIELEGTYPLPEAQLDRFLIKLSTGYVSDEDAEVQILKRRSAWGQDDPTEQIESVTTEEEFRLMQELIEREIYVDDQIYLYISRIVRATRESPYVDVGASPRGGLSLFKVSKANAAINGRDYVIPDDVKLYAVNSLAHRLIMKLEYALEDKITPGSIIEEILDQVEAPKEIMRR